MSYNDCILEGVQGFKKAYPDVDVYLYSPGSPEEAEKIFSDWLKRPGSDIPVLFVLAGSDYEAMAKEYLPQYSLTPNKRLLLFETLDEFSYPGVSTFQISMYGASYLAGVTASLACGGDDALIVLANPIDGPINTAKDGFTDGYGAECDIEYLAEDWTGYIASAQTYRQMADWAEKYKFIFPVAGGSNAGIYRYSREFADCPLLAGMDTDQSGLSTKITGSVIKRIDRLVYEYLQDWLLTGEMPEQRFYGLESGYSDWFLSPLYDKAFESVVEGRRLEAIERERRYHEE